MSFLDRLRGRRSDAGGADVPKDWLKAFDGLLGRTAGTDRGLRAIADAVRSYVLTGEPADAPARVTPYFGQRFSNDQVVRAAARSKNPAERLYPAGLPGAVAFRWIAIVSTYRAVNRWNGTPLALPGGALWPLLLLEETDGHGTHAWLEDAQAAAGWAPHTMIVAALTARDPGWAESRFIRFLIAMPDLAAALHRHHPAVREAFAGPIGVEGIHLAEALVAAPQAASGYAEQVAALLTSASKRTRTAAAPLARRRQVVAPGGTREVLLGIGASGSSAERNLALTVLHEAGLHWDDGALVEQVRAMAAADRSTVVSRLATVWAAAEGLVAPLTDLTDGAEGPRPGAVPEAVADAPSLPHVEPVTVDRRVQITPEVRAAIDELARWSTAENERWNRRNTQHQPSRWAVRSGKPIDAPVWADLLDLLASDRTHPLRARSWTPVGAGVVAGVQRVLPRLGAVGAFKVLAFFGSEVSQMWTAAQVLPGAPDVPDLLTALAVHEPYGGSPDSILGLYCSTYYGFGVGWPDDAVWPFFTRHADVVERFVHAEPTYGVSRERLFAGMATVPVLPPTLVRPLMALALGSGSRDRLAAQKALTRVPGKQARIVAALADGKGDVRAAAARWLGDLGDPAVVPALEAAWAKEKQDVARAGILGALEALGRPVEAYLDVAALLRDAAKAATKPVPAALSWLAVEALPTVRWAAGTEHAGEPVPADLVRHLAVQAVKAKSPEPNALLRRYCALWDERDRQAFGAALLTGWLAQDLAPISPDEARKRAADEARMWRGWFTSSPQHYRDHEWFGLTEEQIAATLFPLLQRTPGGSAIDSKGLLAVVAACAGGDVAAPVNRYLKDWYGKRLAQAKALVVMLAHVDHPAATALLLAVGNRFRTKGIQEEASRQVEALAERRGWTVDELADRTIPTAGLDEDGVLALDYGGRTFSAVLRPDLTLTLRSPDGGDLKALPGPRADDDADLAAAAKKTVTAAKKELKATVEQQTGRLYEAMCTGREWSFEDWDTYLDRHPVVRHLVQRLVWMQVAPGGGDRPTVLATFRPLDDGTLTDVADEPVTMPADARVRLAHDAFLPAATVADWTAHLADYEVVAPFGQLGAGFWAPTPEQARGTTVSEFEGHLLEAFALRGRASRLGWQRGAAEDGGVFVQYRKRFPTLRLVAVLGFSGNFLPEENRTVALGELSFERIVEGADTWNAPVVPLADVPPVLLSECRNDVRLMAAEGTGYDPDWERTTAW